MMEGERGREGVARSLAPLPALWGAQLPCPVVPMGSSGHHADTIGHARQAADSPRRRAEGGAKNGALRPARVRHLSRTFPVHPFANKLHFLAAQAPFLLYVLLEPKNYFF